MDEIHVFSREKDAFYNRVLLPEYVNETLGWDKLQKFQAGEFEGMNVRLSLDNEITAINRQQKYVVDRQGQKHAYDKLIIATGSRANVPKDAPVHLPGVFTMRTRQDADRLRDYLKPEANVLIIGGGLLGLELAASLEEINMQVTILHLGSRLMARQIDNLSGQLLLDFVEEKGIQVLLNDQVQSIDRSRSGEGLSAQLRSGRVLEVDAIVYAVGTKPNIELVQEAGIETASGVIVNDYLQTSDPDIFAVGEIAEHNGKMMGITSAAEKQADIAARFINGDVQSRYDGAVPMNILKFTDLNLCSIGIAEIPANGQGYDEILFIDKSMRYYKKCIVKDDRLVGAVMIGDKSEFAEFKSLIESNIELSERRMQLLRSGKKAEPVVGKLVCACNQVGKGNLVACIESGCNSLNELCKATGAGLGCGSCKPEIQGILKEMMVKVE
jgi:ferredoxin-nitrate reductase